MDATQLSLFLTAKLQSSSKMTLQLSDDSNGADKVFADMLKKRAAEESEQERQTELDRQNWRSQPASYTPSQVSSAPSTSPSYSASTDNGPRSTSNSGTTSSATTTKTSQQTTSRDNSGSAAANQQQSKAQASSADNRGTATTQRKSDKAKDSAGSDDNQAAGDQPALATADGASTSKHPATFDQGADGENASGNGQNQGQHGQDDSQKQQQADGTGDGTAMATSVEGAILAGLMVGQPIVASSATGGTQSTAGGAQVTGINAAAAGLGGNGAAQGSIAAAAAQANAAMAQQSLSGSGATTGTGTALGPNIAANAGLPQGAEADTAATGTANRPSQQELAANFANMVARNTSTTAANSETARISITKTDSAPQMPKPLVKIDSDHTDFSTTDTAGSTGESETTSAETAASFSAGLEASDDGSDDFRSFTSYSPLLAGGSGSVLIGKPVDPLAALRQQLASASVQDQIAVHMQRAAKDSVDKISIQLSPTELGQIHVKMKVDDDKNVTATITVERPATLDLLQRDTKTLERALQEAGLKTDTGSLSFSLQRGNQGDSSDSPGWGQGNGRRVGASGQENNAGTAEISAATAGNEVDTANGLVNVAV
jgi:hypothetical protein